MFERAREARELIEITIDSETLRYAEYELAWRVDAWNIVLHEMRYHLSDSILKDEEF